MRPIVEALTHHQNDSSITAHSSTEFQREPFDIAHPDGVFPHDPSQLEHLVEALRGVAEEVVPVDPDPFETTRLTAHLQTRFGELKRLDEQASGGIAEEVGLDILEVDAEPYTASSKRPRLGYTCEECQKTYKHERALARHRHTDEHRRQVGLPPGARFLCREPGCTKTFTRDYDRTRHEREIHQHIRRAQPRNDPPSSAAGLSRSEPFDRPLDGIVSDLEDHDPLHDDYFSAHSASYGYGDRHAVLYSSKDANPVLPTSSIESQSGPSDDSMYRHEVEDDSRDAATKNSDNDLPNERPTSTALESKELSKPTKSVRSSIFDLPIRTLKSRSSLIRQGANPRPKKNKDPDPCPLCHRQFGESLDEVRGHLHRHMNELQSEHMCLQCRIGFRDPKDLQMHQTCASGTEPHCGFKFEHNRPCMGHHGPGEIDFEYEYSDRFKFWYWLKDWEQATLQLYMDRVNDMSQRQHITLRSDCWSIGAIVRRSMARLSRLGITLAHNSIPDYLQYESRIGFTTVQQSFKPSRDGFEPSRDALEVTEDSFRILRESIDMSMDLGIFRSHDRLLRTEEIPSIQRASTPELFEAIKIKDIDRAKAVIVAGTDVNTCIAMDPGSPFTTSPLIAAGLNDDPAMVAMLVSMGANVNLRFPHTRYGTALCSAASAGACAAVRCLLNHDADVHLEGSGKMATLSTVQLAPAQ